MPAVFVLVAIPGQDVLFVLAVSAKGGPRNGLAAVLGIMTAFFCVHLLAAVLGLSALVAHSAVLFLCLKYAGAAYLIVLGAQTLMRRSMPAAEHTAPPPSRKGSAFAQGFVTNALNPKVALFMLSFLPQFIVRSQGHITSQIVVLGVAWGITGAIVLSVVAFASGKASALRARSKTFQNLERWVAGSLLVGIGLRVAMPERL